MNRSLSAASERMGRGSCVAVTGIRQRVNDRQALQLNTQRRRAYTSWIVAHCLCDLAPSLSQQRKTGRALCWIGLLCSALLRRTKYLFAHRPRKPPRIRFVTSHGYFRQENIREKIISVSRKEGKEGGSRDFFPLVVSVLLQLLGETHGSLCPKGAVALWTAFGFFFLESLLLSLHGCTRFKRSRLRRPLVWIILFEKLNVKRGRIYKTEKVISWLLCVPANLATSKVCALALSRF